MCVCVTVTSLKRETDALKLASVRAGLLELSQSWASLGRKCTLLAESQMVRHTIYKVLDIRRPKSVFLCMESEDISYPKCTVIVMRQVCNYVSNADTCTSSLITELEVYLHMSSRSQSEGSAYRTQFGLTLP